MRIRGAQSYETRIGCIRFREFDTGRYAYDIDVESLPAVPNYTSELRDVLGDGLVVYDSEKFETVREMVFHGDLDE